MNQTDFDRWKSEALNHIFQALIVSEDINKTLIFKGARILNLILGDERQSLDIDSNLTVEFTQKFPDRESQKRFLDEHVNPAITRYFNRQEPVRYELKRIRIDPTKPHPLGWDAFTVSISLIDHEKAHVQGLPSLDVDIAAPEELNARSVMSMTFGTYPFRAYTLERIAGEKMRAFLSTLSAYRKKVKKPGEAVRVKDLHDLARILRAHPITKTTFWEEVGIQFKLACKSRFVDCQGLSTFQENWEFTRDTYEKDTRLRDTVPFPDAENALKTIVSFIEAKHIVPFTFPLEPGASTS